MQSDCAVCTDKRLPLHRHDPDSAYVLSATQHKALGYVRRGAVHILIAACGPDDAERASVDHHDRPYWVREQELPHWNTYKALYLHGVINLRQRDPRFPYDYVAEPNTAHPINIPPVRPSSATERAA